MLPIKHVFKYLSEVKFSQLTSYHGGSPPGLLHHHYHPAYHDLSDFTSYTPCIYFLLIFGALGPLLALRHWLTITIIISLPKRRHTTGLLHTRPRNWASLAVTWWNVRWHDGDSCSPCVTHRAVFIMSHITVRQTDFVGKKSKNAYALMLIKGPWSLLFCWLSPRVASLPRQSYWTDRLIAEGTRLRMLVH